MQPAQYPSQLQPGAPLQQAAPYPGQAAPYPGYPAPVAAPAPAPNTTVVVNQNQEQSIVMKT